jgi:hypothetical protein
MSAASSFHVNRALPLLDALRFLPESHRTLARLAQWVGPDGPPVKKLLRYVKLDGFLYPRSLREEPIELQSPVFRLSIAKVELADTAKFGTVHVYPVYVRQLLKCPRGQFSFSDIQHRLESRRRSRTHSWQLHILKKIAEPDCSSRMPFAHIEHQVLPVQLSMPGTSLSFDPRLIDEVERAVPEEVGPFTLIHKRMTSAADFRCWRYRARWCEAHGLPPPPWV